MTSTQSWTTLLASHLRPGLTNRLAAGAIAGPVLFTLAFTVLGAQRPGYSPVRQQVSVLALGPHGVWLDTAFILCGVLMIVGVQGIRRSLLSEMNASGRRVLTVLLSVPPLGLILCGFFPINSSTPVHFIGANLTFAGPLISFLATGILLLRVRRLRRLGFALLVAAVLTALALYAYFVSAPVRDLRTIAGGGTLGLWERILGIEIFCWYVLLGVLALGALRRGR